MLGFNSIGSVIFFVWATLLGAFCPFSYAQNSSHLPFSLPIDANKLPNFALIETSKGQFEVLLFRQLAPIAVRNFKYLASSGFYNGMTFHHYVPDFIIQTGLAKSSGNEKVGYTLPSEFSTIRHVPGTIGMGRLPDRKNPERRSHGSQFYISLTRAPHLDGVYVVFGRVVQGMETVVRLRPDDRILGIRFAMESDIRSSRDDKQSGDWTYDNLRTAPAPVLPGHREDDFTR